MVSEHSLTTLFHTYADLDKPPILELRNIDNKPVGALYLKDLRYKNFINHNSLNKLLQVGEQI